MPNAMTRPERLSRFKVKPTTRIPIKVNMMLNGIDSEMMVVARTSARNRKITTTAIRTPNAPELTTVINEASTLRLSSESTVHRIAPPLDLSKSSMTARIPREIFNVLPSNRLVTEINIKGRPSEST